MSTLFISYAHEDEKWRKLIESHLKVLELNGQARLEVWSDQQLQTGSDWKAAIEQKIEAASIAILILTPDFIGSDFIRRMELPYLLERRERQRLRIIPVLARSFAYGEIPSLAQLQIKTAAGRSLSEVQESEQDSLLIALVKEIKETLKPPLPATPLSPPVSSPGFKASALFPTTPVAMEVCFRHRRANEYYVDIQYSDTRKREENRSVSYQVKIDMGLLESLRENPEEYARSLDRLVFGHGAPRTVRDIYYQNLGELGAKLEVNIGANAWELQSLFWETLLVDYVRGSAPGPHAEIFSRSVCAAGEGWPSPTMRAWPEFKICIYHLEGSGTSEVEALLNEYSSIAASESVPVEVLPGRNGLAGLETIDAKVLLLLIHLDSGADEPTILARNAESVPTAFTLEEFSSYIRSLSSRPQVIILDAAGDQGANRDQWRVGESLVRVAAELITTGACAVVTRQAPIEQRAWLSFLARFASELGRTGNLDLAAAAARLAIGRTDAWKPVTMTRLRMGQVWYRPAFLGDSSTAWDLLIDRVSEGLCVPIIGPLVSEHVIRSRGDIAEKIAAKFNYPGRRSERRELRKVAQYVATTLEPRRVRKQYENSVKQYLRKRYGATIKDFEHDQPLQLMLKATWDSVLSTKPDDPYTLLAELQSPLYLSTNLHNYLSLAIAGRCDRASDATPGQPRDFARERIFAEEERIIGEEEDADERTFSLNKQNPIVYHLFGRLDKPETMILTEDDHFRFLLRFPAKWARFPSRVRSHISDSALLFLGFDMGEWEFRSVLRALLEVAGSDVLRENTHVAVQVSMDDDTFSDPERTQKYLVEYFNQISLKPQVFLGSAQEFLIELNQRLKQAR